MSWTDERISTLKKMWQQGKSASEIAEKLGGVTRNAVIGKAHRLGLSGRPSPIKKVVKKIASPAAAPKKAAPAPAKPATPAKSAQQAPAKAPAAALPPKLPQQNKPSGNAPGKPAEIVVLAALANATSRPNGKVISILELNERLCRWPVGDPKDPNFGYCGANAYQAHPYCAEHVAIAFQAPNRKEKKPLKDLKVTEAPELEDLEIEVEIEDDEADGDDATLETDEDDDDTVVTVV